MIVQMAEGLTHEAGLMDCDADEASPDSSQAFGPCGKDEPSGSYPEGSIGASRGVLADFLPGETSDSLS